MEKIDWSRFNGFSFERLIRALSFELFGLKGVVYSSGADGGRDFTFNGPIPEYGWDGYLIVQAKFKETPGTAAQNLTWLRKQISDEKKKFLDRDAKRPLYYIIATNVSLSGADLELTGKRSKSGGVSKVEADLKTWKADLGVVGFDVWHGDKVSDILAGHEDIRRLYAAWLTSGDVLSKVMARLSFEEVNFEDAVRKAMRNSIRRDQYARLRDAGDVTDPQVRTSQVFIDLPMYEEGFSELDFDDDSSRLVTQLVERSCEKFDPDLNVATPNGIPIDGDAPARNKVVILGGPGQGKSTASMYAAQLFRAALLSSYEHAARDLQTLNLSAEILARAQEQRIPKPRVSRFPIFVSLPRFADAISSARAAGLALPSLLGQIAADLASASDVEIGKRDVRVWLTNYPWIVICDGLDEVPASGERKAVLDAVVAFEGEIYDAAGDVFLVITTRPQGYNEELSPMSWEHWTLDDLSADDAMAYGEALGLARYPADPDRRKDLLSALQSATEKPAIARLMVSPLQVTIMHMIVDTGGSVPSARWTLFSEYFEILKKREKAKGGENQRVIERNWNVLGPIHQRAGLILQIDSERAGAAQAFLNESRFLQLAESYFLAEGFERDEVRSRSKELVQVALHRLVLLSARDEGQITFDVRSLQEFMAAGALTSGPPEFVIKRLSHISGVAHWRHVFLIAASRCFSEDVLHHLRQLVVGIPRQLDALPNQQHTQAGAKLSFALFVDGVGVDHPLSRRMLTQHALSILTTGGLTREPRLLALADSQNEDIIKSCLREGVLSDSVTLRLAAWQFLLMLAADQPTQYLDMAVSLWPKNADKIIDLIPILPFPLPSALIANSVHDSLASVNPGSIVDKLRYYASKVLDRASDEDRFGKTKKLDAAHRRLSKLLMPWVQRPHSSADLRVDGTPSGLRINYLSLEDFRRVTSGISLGRLGSQWEFFVQTAGFASDPDMTKLVGLLEGLDSSEKIEHAKQILSALPWPVSSFIAAANLGLTITGLVKKLEHGEFGGVADWNAAHARWKQDGLVFDDFRHDNLVTPFSSDIAEAGSPIVGSRYQIVPNRKSRMPEIKEFLDILRESRCDQLRQMLLHLATMLVVASHARSLPLSEPMRVYLGLIAEESPSTCSLSLCLALGEEVWEDEYCVSKIATIANVCNWLPRYEHEYDSAHVVAACNRFPGARGLLVLAVLLCQAEVEERVKVFKELNPELLSVRDDDSPRIKVVLDYISAHVSAISPITTFRTAVEDEAGWNFAVRVIRHLLRNDDSSAMIIRWVPVLLLCVDNARGSASRDLIGLLEGALSSQPALFVSEAIWNKELALWSDVYPVLDVYSE